MQLRPRAFALPAMLVGLACEGAREGRDDTGVEAGEEDSADVLARDDAAAPDEHDDDAPIRPDDGGTDDSGPDCPDGTVCMADFPCGHPLSGVEPGCRGSVRYLPRDVPCERICGTPCCGGSGCERVEEPCGEGETCELTSSWAICVAACRPVPTFADTMEVTRTLYVSPDAGDVGADGSWSRPFRTIGAAARAAVPGTEIRLLPGTHHADQYLADLDSVRIVGGGPGAAIVGGTQALHLVRPRRVVVEDLVVEGSASNGINVDDGGDGTGTAEEVLLRRVTFQDIGSDGNQDCLKLSGVDRFFVMESSFYRCASSGTSGSGIDMVGCHDGLIAHSLFREMGGNAVQAKGGSARVEIRGNRIADGGERALNLGGSTGIAYFRPAGADYEAMNIVAVSNLILGSEAPVAFVGCDGCLAANNTIVEPGRWIIRILQESVDGFVPCRNGRFINNIVVFNRSEVATLVNVGPNTAPDTFVFSNNLWHALDDPSFAGPVLPVEETSTILGDPLFFGVDDHHLDSGSPARGAGIPLAEVAGDLEGWCRGSPPSVGAYE
jgi:hypothetical protein